MSLEPRILRGIQAEFTRALYEGFNPSGFRPIGDNVLVLMDQCADHTTGNILLPPEKIEQMNHASESGCIVAIGKAAFSFYGDGSKWDDVKPGPGDRVFTEKYAGRELLGQDGKTYRMMTYTCIAGMEDLQPVVEPSKKPKRKG